MSTTPSSSRSPLSGRRRLARGGVGSSGPRRAGARMVLASFIGLLLTVLVPTSTDALAQDASEVDSDDVDAVVEVLPISGLLDPPVVGAIRDLLEQADQDGAELVVLQVSGPGGVSVDVPDLLAAIDDADVPVAVLVAPQAGVDAMAGGAWAALWSAADIRGVAEVATVGPMLPTDLASDDEAPGLVDDVTARLGASGAGVLDTAMTAAALEEAGVVDVNAPDVVTMLGDLDGRDVGGGRVLSLAQDQVNVRLHSLGLVARMLHAAATPAFIYLLLVIGLSLLAFELFQPGFGVAGFAGLVMLPFAVFGLTVLPVVWWALGLLLVGLALYVVDTALAGLGLRTLAATAAFAVGSWWLFGTGPLRNPGWVAGATTALALAFWVVVMTTILRAQAGPEGIELDDLVGRPGMVRSVLNPEGHVYIDEALWRARLEGAGRLKVGSPVQVVAVDGAVLVVAAFDPDRRPAAATAPAGSTDVSVPASSDDATA